jgi:hypothetical protein
MRPGSDRQDAGGEVMLEFLFSCTVWKLLVVELVGDAPSGFLAWLTHAVWLELRHSPRHLSQFAPCLE